jgi:hypothetical protein
LNERFKIDSRGPESAEFGPAAKREPAGTVARYPRELRKKVRQPARLRRL